MKLTRAQKIALEAFDIHIDEDLDFYEHLRNSGTYMQDIMNLAVKIEYAMHEELNERYLKIINSK